MLDQPESKFSDLLIEVPRHYTVQRISQGLQRFLTERSAVLYSTLILDALEFLAPIANSLPVHQTPHANHRLTAVLWISPPVNTASGLRNLAFPYTFAPITLTYCFTHCWFRTSQRWLPLLTTPAHAYT
ncbi:hypothetical protein, partial [Salmonella enterica]|uniref:hypothetical protein n=1 Tax=Salmonella enterica TaxID=28901 RepID=UPI00398C2B8E